MISIWRHRNGDISIISERKKAAMAKMAAGENRHVSRRNVIKAAKICESVAAAYMKMTKSL